MIFDNKNTIGTIPPQIHEEPSHEAAVENDYSNQGMATSNIGVTNNDWFSREIEETENVTIEHDNTAQMLADQIKLSPSRNDEYHDLPE